MFFGYSDIHLVFGSVLISVRLFRYRNIGTIRIFENFGPVLVLVLINLVRFFGSGFLSRASFSHSNTIFTLINILLRIKDLYDRMQRDNTGGDF